MQTLVLENFLNDIKSSCFNDNKIYAHFPSWIIDLQGTLKLHYFKRIRDITVQIKQQIYASTRNDKYFENVIHGGHCYFHNCYFHNTLICSPIYRINPIRCSKQVIYLQSISKIQYFPLVLLCPITTFKIQQLQSTNHWFFIKFMITSKYFFRGNNT